MDRKLLSPAPATRKAASKRKMTEAEDTPTEVSESSPANKQAKTGHGASASSKKRKTAPAGPTRNPEAKRARTASQVLKTPHGHTCNRQNHSDYNNERTQIDQSIRSIFHLHRRPQKGRDHALVDVKNHGKV